jgi:2-dehydropantoate 2-reductase
VAKIGNKIFHVLLRCLVYLQVPVFGKITLCAARAVYDQHEPQHKMNNRNNMKQKLKIVIVGIGGVGGYFGGLLARKYEESDAVEIIFVARGEHLDRMQQEGLKVIKGPETFVARPAIATADLGLIGIADFIILSTKSYDLEKAVQQLRPCAGTNTILLPLLNGVDSRAVIQELLPQAIVLNGCAYIVSRLRQPGIVENTGNIQTLYFGPDKVPDARMEARLCYLERLLTDAGIEAAYSKDSLSVIWEKFIFISPTATATSWFNVSTGRLLAEHRETVRSLIEEVYQVALAMGINTPEGMQEKTLQKLASLPYDTASSMHNDYKNKKPDTEMESLTGYVVRAGRALNIPTPTYDEAYRYLLQQNA